MHHLEIDWYELAQRVPTWRALRPATRAHLLDTKPSDAYHTDRFGPDLPALLEAQFVHVASTGRATVHPTHRPFARALRAMDRHDILGTQTSATLAGYIHDNYTNEESGNLTSGLRKSWQYDHGLLVRHVMSRAWLKAPLEGARAIQHTSRLQLSSTAWVDASKLVRVVVERGGVLPVAELPDVLPPVRVRAAVLAALAEVWLFATLRRPDAEPVLAVWPGTLARLQRQTRAPAVVTDARSATSTMLFDDMSAVLVEAAAEPLRLRGHDGTLFARTAQRIAQTLTPQPAPVAALISTNPERRLQFAVGILRNLGYIRVRGERGRDMRLEPLPAGRQWLAAPLSERLRPLLDIVREGVGTTPQDDAPVAPPSLRLVTSAELDDFDQDMLDQDMLDQDLLDQDLLDEVLLDEDLLDEDLLDDFDDDDFDGPGGAHGIDPWNDYVAWTSVSVLGSHIQPRTLHARVLDSVTATLRRLPHDGCVDVAQLLQHAAETDNPLESDLERFAAIDGRYLDYETEEDRELRWQRILQNVLTNWFVPLGGVRVGESESDRLVVGLTPLGQYMLGLTAQLDVAALGSAAAAGDAVAPQVIVQPNFDIVFMTPSPIAEAEIGRFAERTGSGVGTVFRITRASITAAAAAGMDSAATLDTLHQLSAQPLPANVEREIRGWFDLTRHVHARHAWVIDAPDEETAMRVLRSAGKHGRRIGTLTIELTDTKQRSTLVRRLRKDGIFLDEDPPEKARTPARRARRSTWDD